MAIGKCRTALVFLVLGGCGVSTTTTESARGATYGSSAFLFVKNADLVGSVALRLNEQEPRYSAAVEFSTDTKSAVRLVDVRVGVSWTRGGATVWFPDGTLEVSARGCDPAGRCQVIGASSWAGGPGSARAAPPRALDDFILTVTYTVERDGRTEVVTRRISAHAVHKEERRHLWFFKEC